jgi:hypothetical protein
MYIVRTCTYNVCTFIYHVCTWYNQLSQQVFVADSIRKRDADAGLRNITWPSESAVQDDMDGGQSRRWRFFIARPDAAKTEEAINSSLSGICVQYGVPMYSVCTCLYAVCTRIWQLYALYVHVLISCLNSHSEGVYRRYIPV